MQTRDTQVLTESQQEPIMLTESQLAKRWLKSEIALKKERYAGRGPRFMRLGRHIRYSLADVIAYEQAHTIGGQS
jgi:hypothetical protein